MSMTSTSTTGSSPSAPPNAGEPASQHPFIVGLIQELPPLGSHFEEEERHSWLRAAASIFDLMYHVEDPVQVGPVATTPAPVAVNAIGSSAPSSGTDTSSAPADPTATATSAPASSS